MTNPSIADNDPPRRSRTRRREAMINAIATVLGCMALVVMIATIVRVVMVKLWESARVNPAYVQSVYDDGGKEPPVVRNSQPPSKPRLLARRPAPRFRSQPRPATAIPGPARFMLATANVIQQSCTLRPGSPPPWFPTSLRQAVSSIQDIDSKRSQDRDHACAGFFESG
jgi:hypothetical protein